MNAMNMTLTGMGTTFPATQQSLYFRLESKDDIAGSKVIMKIEKDPGSGFASFRTDTFNNPQFYGHIFLSSFYVGQIGTFRVTGIVLSCNKSIATVGFTMN